MAELALRQPETMPGHFGCCAICGTKGEFSRGSQQSVREDYACPQCEASLRYRDQAACILDEFGKGMEISLNRLAKSGRLDHLHIYEPALRGPFVRAFNHLPHYTRSYYWDNGKHGEIQNGVRFEDLKQLSFAEESLDLVITSDVMEHVIDPYLAFSEIARALKVGGVHIFSIPTVWPLPAESVQRVQIRDDEIEHVLPPRFHRAGDGSQSIVVTDFGSDIVDKLSELGMMTQIVRRSLSVDPLYQNATFVARKMANSARKKPTGRRKVLGK